MPTRWLSQWVESWRYTNSQHSKKLCLSLSLLMSENLKLKKVIKSFVPEPKRVVKCFVFFGFLCVLNILCVMNIYERCMYMYITRIRILVVYFWTWILQHRGWEAENSNRRNKLLMTWSINQTQSIQWGKEGMIKAFDRVLHEWILESAKHFKDITSYNNIPTIQYGKMVY